MSNPTQEPTEVEALRAEVKHYKAALDGCDRQLAEAMRELHKTKCELIKAQADLDKSKTKGGE